ncbi:hypothetical protein BCI9360_00647 [Bacillus sp. CECT 9360]|nr:hypothetical protein BCI9360_00647 [Bacillus sp. CECT 9360]
MNKKYNIVIWAALYAVIVYFIYSEFLKVDKHVDTDLFLEQSLFRLQKFLYNTSIFFIMYLFILKLPFASAMFVSRCREELPMHLITYGLRICIIYVIYSVSLHIGIPYFFGTKIPITAEVVLNTVKLFSFVLSMYFLYLYIYIKTNQQVLGLLSIFVLNLTILTIYFSISFGLGISPTKELELNLLSLISTGLIIVYVMLIIYECKNRDFV